MVGYGWLVMRFAMGHKVVVVTLDMKGAREGRPHFLLRPELSSKRAGLWDEEEGNRLCLCMCLHKRTDDEARSSWNLYFTAQICLLSWLHCDRCCFWRGNLDIVRFSLLVSDQFVLSILGVQICIHISHCLFQHQ